MFQLSGDPLLVDKVFDVVGLYLNPPKGAVVLCVDEKSQVQALARWRLAFSMMPGIPEKGDPRLRTRRHDQPVRGVQHRRRHRDQFAGPPASRVDRATYHRRRRPAALGRLIPTEFEIIMTPAADQAA